MGKTRREYRIELARMFTDSKITAMQLAILINIVDKRESVTDSREKGFFTRKLNQVLNGKNIDYDYMKSFLSPDVLDKIGQVASNYEKAWGKPF